MVTSFFRLIRKEVANLHAAAYTVAIFTFLAQLLALLRDRILAHSFGASELLDIYYAAFKLPDLLFALIASLVSAYILIPLIARAGEESKKKARELLSDAVMFLTIVLGATAAVAAAFTPQILTALYPSFADSSLFSEFVLLTRILLLQPILLGISSVISSVTQLERRFLLYALSGVFYNVGIIFGILVLEPLFGIAGLGYGVVLGAFMHMALHIPIVVSSGLAPYLKFPDVQKLRHIIIHSFPRALALSSHIIIAVVVTMLAAPLKEGSITIFSFAYNLEGVPLALIGASYAVVAFPTLATLYAANEVENFVKRVADAARHLILWSTFALVIFVVLRAHLVRVILGSGEFTWDDTRLTAAVLALLVTALVGQALVLLIARAYYAAGKTFIPLIIQGAGAAVSIFAAMGLLYVHGNVPGYTYFIESILRISFVPGTEIASIALGVALGQIFAGVLAFVLFAHRYKGFAKIVVPVFFQSFAAAVIGGATAYLTLSLLGGIFALTSLTAVLAQGVLAGTLGLTVFLFVLWGLSNKEFQEIRAGISNFLVKKKLEPQSEF
tara:strand:- start:334050 stop:335720 length:1671 start_codon:yes stop_codon:yes gene_type:complete